MPFVEGFSQFTFFLTMRPFRNAAILLGLSAGVALAASTPAQAQFLGCGTTSAGGFVSALPASCVIGDKLYTFSGTVDGVTLGTNIHGFAQLTMAENGGAQHTLTLSSANGLQLVSGASSPAFFNYTITVNSGSETLKTWQTDTQGAIAPNDYVNTTAFSNDASGVSPIALKYCLPSGGGGPCSTGPNDFVPGTTTTLVTHSITNEATTTGFTDTVVQTPGPLPILGAGAAFGFTRKLRNRIKAVA
jgi:hypothetical protein